MSGDTPSVPATLRAVGRRARYAGRRVTCELCGGHFGRFADQRDGWAVLCPRCGSLPRQRLLWRYLREAGFSDRAGLDILHIAPEPGLESRLRAFPGAHYTSVDLHDPRATVMADLTDLPFAADAFDLVLCSHVLEHVPDDRKAMGELARVLRPGGLAIIQSPVNYEMAATHEDPTLTDEEERLRRFSQRDHVRVYGPDLRERLVEAGFDVTVYDPADRLPASVTARYGLEQPPGPLRNDLYACVVDDGLPDVLEPPAE
jgi:SAM-dependent methyltransferase